ncbi:MAG: hypothetical protein NC350_04160 [Corallococcus sp.]|nr:hypothetical protein [Corallococcus sp.]
MPKPLICDIPYPKISEFNKDVRSAKIISFAYATLHGELTATLQYVYHSHYMQNYDANFAETLNAVAMAEMIHLDLLGKAMLKMGADPVYRQLPREPDVYYNTSRVAYTKTPPKMLLDDIQGEINAIADYKKMLSLLENEQAATLIQRIVMDEELHLAALKEMYQTYSLRNCK